MNSVTETTRQFDLVELTALIVGAYVTRNPVSPGDLPRVIADVHAALSSLGKTEVSGSDREPRAPAVPVKRSVRQDAIICLDCGKTFKSLKRHLMTSHGLTPDGYKARWGLPHDYPPVAPLYAEVRSKLARGAGLGRKPAANTRQRPR